MGVMGKTGPKGRIRSSINQDLFYFLSFCPLTLVIPDFELINFPQFFNVPSLIDQIINTVSINTYHHSRTAESNFAKFQTGLCRK